MLLTPETRDFLSTVTGGYSFDAIYTGSWEYPYVVGDYIVWGFACEDWTFDPIYLGC